MKNEAWDTRDCLPSSKLRGYMYADKVSQEYKPCLQNCKVCNGPNTCKVCGNSWNENKEYFLIQNTSPHKCIENCEEKDHRHKLPSSPDREFDCVQCDAGTYYLDGSRPAQCVDCQGPGQMIRGKGCYQCGGGCKSCDEKGICLECLDQGHLVQVDKKTCQPKCQEKEMGISTTPKRCQPCPEGCARCYKSTGCTKCEFNFYPNPSPNNCKACPSGCGSCLSQQQCLSCSDPSHFLGTDGITCSTLCKEKEYKDKKEKKCKRCPENCLTCSESQGCTQCNKGYFKHDGACSVCGEGCSECLSLSLCLSCINPLKVIATDKTKCSFSCNTNEFKHLPTQSCRHCSRGCEK